MMETNPYAQNEKSKKKRKEAICTKEIDKSKKKERKRKKFINERN